MVEERWMVSKERVNCMVGSKPWIVDYIGYSYSQEPKF